ncbi:MAG: hypothetical protein QNK19_11610 [Xanthomonadales bacterium]|nr:hypothetical protein [Xanthomonadales bacterium]
MRKFIFILLSWLASSAFASEPCSTFFQSSIRDTGIPAESVYAMLNTQRQRGCILGATDTTGIEAQYQKLFQSTLSPEDVAIARGQLLELLLGQFNGVPRRICNLLTPDCVAGRHAEALNQLANGINSGEFDFITASLDDWVPVEADGRIKISNVELNKFLESECKAGVSEPACAGAVEIAAKIMRTSLAINQLIVSHRQPIIGVNDQFLSDRDREWENYLNGVSVQYPWELAFNSWRFDRTTEDTAKFPRAPNSRWVLLHPSPALEVIDTINDNNSLEPAILVEMFGYQRWKWQNGQQRNRWGVSGILSIADINGMDNVGYGALVQTPIRNMAFGVVWRDGNEGSEIAFVLNLDLAKLLKQYDNDDLQSFLNR